MKEIWTREKCHETSQGGSFSQVNHREEIGDLYNSGYSMNEVSQATLDTR